MKNEKKKYPAKMICISIDMEKTGANIKRLSREYGYSVEEIMKITGVSTPQAVYKWFSGKSIPSMETLLVLSEIFETGVKDILVINGDIRGASCHERHYTEYYYLDHQNR